MKIFEKRNTSEVKSRRRRFFAFCLVLILSMLPAATVFAVTRTYDLGYPGGSYPDEDHDIRGVDVYEGDELVVRSGNLWVIYEDINERTIDESIVAGEDYDSSHTVEKINNINSWTVKGQEKTRLTEFGPAYAKITLKEKPASPDPDDPKKKDDPKKDDPKKDDPKKDDKGKVSSKKKHSDDSEPWNPNPDAITAFYYLKNGTLDPTAKIGKETQGAVASSMFNSNLPAGWKAAFTFSMSTDGQHTYTLKDGTIKLLVPAEFQKEGRQYAILAMGPKGVVKFIEDSDTLPAWVTVSPNVEGYAYELIYMD